VAGVLAGWAEADMGEPLNMPPAIARLTAQAVLVVSFMLSSLSVLF
jgi:hypothetical protein